MRINKDANKKVSLFHSTIEHTAKFDQADVIGFSAWRNMNRFDKAHANRVSGDGETVASTFRYLFSIRSAVSGSITLSVGSLVGQTPQISLSDLKLRVNRITAPGSFFCNRQRLKVN